MTGTERGNKRGARRGLVLQPRDLDILRELSVMRVADREQVKIAAAFGSTTRVNARLLALARAALSAKGAQLIHVSPRGPRRRQDEMLVADFFVQHQLSVNTVYCALKFGIIPVRGVRFLFWHSFHEVLTPELSLIPDGYVEFATPQGIVSSFIEVDLGHEGLAVWKEKTRHYLQLALSGTYERQFKQPRFRVLVLAHSARRVHSIRATVATVTEKIFWFATLDGVLGEKFFGPVWLRPTGEIHQPFFNGTL
jgi:hypothetical protein